MSVPFGKPVRLRSRDPRDDYVTILPPDGVPYNLPSPTVTVELTPTQSGLHTYAWPSGASGTFTVGDPPPPEPPGHPCDLRVDLTPDVVLDVTLDG